MAAQWESPTNLASAKLVVPKIDGNYQCARPGGMV